MRTGAYVSPHIERWSERVLVGGAEIAEADFAAAVERVAESVEAVNRALEDGEAVTQFEAATAAAFVALAAAGVEVGGDRGRPRRPAGRHQRDPLARDGADLGWARAHGVARRDRAGDRRREARRPARPLDAGDRRAGPRGRAAGAREPPPSATPASSPRGRARRWSCGARGAYQRRNFAVALAAAEAILGRLDPDAVREVAAGLELPGRVEVAGGDPPLVLDAAHNPDGARALAEALPEAAAARRSSPVSRS